jgi:Ca2+-binding RTX toxin-like protein
MDDGQSDLIRDTHSGACFFSSHRKRTGITMTMTRKMILSLVPTLLASSLWTVSALAGPPRCFGQDATIVSSGEIEGTSGDDVIVGSNGSDEIRGLGGDDLICGRSGFDTIDGGAGNDNLGGGDKSDTLRGGSGNDRLRGGRMFDFLEGGPGDDKIGNRSHSWNDSAIYKNAPGAVTIDLEQGTASGEGSDTLVGIHFLQLSIYDDVIRGTDRKENIRDFGGADELTLLGGDDFVYPPAGQDGNDIFDLGAGDDFANAGSGDDFIDGGDGSDSAGGGDGTDECVNVEDAAECEP